MLFVSCSESFWIPVVIWKVPSITTRISGPPSSLLNKDHHPSTKLQALTLSSTGWQCHQSLQDKLATHLPFHARTLGPVCVRKNHLSGSVPPNPFAHRGQLSAWPSKWSSLPGCDSSPENTRPGPRQGPAESVFPSENSIGVSSLRIQLDLRFSVAAIEAMEPSLQK